MCASVMQNLNLIHSFSCKGSEKQTLQFQVSVSQEGPEGSWSRIEQASPQNLVPPRLSNNIGTVKQKKNVLLNVPWNGKLH